MNRLIGIAVVLTLLGAAEARAQDVALGDSSTRGYMLPVSDAWPAKLEALLHQHGANVSVANEGINGDTSDGMLGRVDSAVPNGTRVVVFTCCANDNKDERHGVANHDENIRTIVSGLRVRGIAVVYIGQRLSGEARGHDDTGAAIARKAGASWCGWVYQGVPPGEIEDSPDGRHPTPAGYDKIAERVLPCALRALGRKG
jgi:acyl-CoA thioesterase I